MKGVMSGRPVIMAFSRDALTSEMLVEPGSSGFDGNASNTYLPTIASLVAWVDLRYALFASRTIKSLSMTKYGYGDALNKASKSIFFMDLIRESCKVCQAKYHLI